jgi:hypothetical protein
MIGKGTLIAGLAATTVVAGVGVGAAFSLDSETAEHNAVVPASKHGVHQPGAVQQFVMAAEGTRSQGSA